MSRSWKIGTGGLLVMGLFVGCRQTQPHQQAQECTTCAGSSQVQAPVNSAPERLSLVPTPQHLAPTAPPSLVPVTPSPIAINTAPRTLPPVTAAPVNPEQSAPPPSPWALPKVEHETPAPSPTPAPTPAPSPMPTSTAAPAPAPPPTPVAANPAGPAPQYFNSPDYSILFGVLDFNARRGTWRLRYADAGEEDRYGGSVTLDGIGRQMEGYSSGQFVRVEGGLVDPESHEVSPAYRVKELRPGSAGK